LASYRSRSWCCAPRRRPWAWPQTERRWPAARPTHQPSARSPFAEAIRTRYFYAVSIAYLFLLGAQVGAIAHLYRLVSGRTGAETAALALASMAMASTIGRLLGGLITLRLPVRTFALALMAAQAVGLALLAVSFEPVLVLSSVALFFGLTIGNSLMMHPLLLAETFGTRDYGRIYSTSQLVTMAGVAGCPALIGMVYELSGGYAAPFLGVAALTGLPSLPGAGRRGAERAHRHRSRAKPVISSLAPRPVQSVCAPGHSVILLLPINLQLECGGRWRQAEGRGIAHDGSSAI